MRACAVSPHLLLFKKKLLTLEPTCPVKTALQPFLLLGRYKLPTHRQKCLVAPVDAFDFAFTKIFHTRKRLAGSTWCKYHHIYISSYSSRSTTYGYVELKDQLNTVWISPAQAIDNDDPVANNLHQT